MTPAITRPAIIPNCVCAEETDTWFRMSETGNGTHVGSGCETGNGTHVGSGRVRQAMEHM